MSTSKMKIVIPVLASWLQRDLLPNCLISQLSAAVLLSWEAKRKLVVGFVRALVRVLCLAIPKSIAASRIENRVKDYILVPTYEW